jgi:aminoglycoside phosphotransferase (APT) family kinase protein
MPEWTPEIAVDEARARDLIAAQFPALADAHIRRVGGGWDNAAFLVAERFIFRFPQRAIAGPLIDRENRLLPLIAPHVPAKIPFPRFAGAPSDAYPWAFSGYEILPGVSACSRVPDDIARQALAEDLARFLRALHSIDAAPLLEAGLPGDYIGRLDPQRLKVEEDPLEGPLCVVHGDVYARHILLDERKRLSGVIDWGDLHYGQPAVDLAAVHLLIPPANHDAFFAVYGAVDDRTWRFARYRARHHLRMIERYCAEIDDEALASAARIAAGFLALEREAH